MFSIARAGAAIVGSLIVVICAAPAHADGIGIESSTEALHFTRLMPGDREAGVFTVRNDTSEAVIISLSSKVTGEAENDCLEPESEVGDLTCTASQGELSKWLTVHVSHGTEFLWSGPVHDLEQSVVLSDEVPAGQTWDLDIAVEIPIDATNEIMTDQLWFDLYVTAVAGEQGQAGGGGTQTITHVLGVEATGESPSGGAGVPSAVAAGLDLPGIRELRELEADRLWMLLVFGLAVMAAAGMTVSRVRRR